MNVWFHNGDLVLPGAQVNFGEVGRMCQSVQQIVYARQRIRITYGALVQHAVIDTHAHGSIFLAHENNRGAPATQAGSHPTLVQVLIQLLPDLIQLALRHAVLPRFGWRCLSIVQQDAMFNLAQGMVYRFAKNVLKLIAELVPARRIGANHFFFPLCRFMKKAKEGDRTRVPLEHVAQLLDAAQLEVRFSNPLHVHHQLFACRE